MKIAVASGKGGTGKTTLATSLAATGARIGRQVTYLDCDVEDPDGHLFLHPEIHARSSVNVLVPTVLEDACTHCGLCTQACLFSAIVGVGQKVMVFPELCCGCGACVRACPCGALLERPHTIGAVETGVSGNLPVVQGRLDVGAAKSPPVIRAVRKAAPDVDWQIIDAPPGASCPMMAAVRDCDLVVLVAEPTPFGLSDLELAVATLRELALPLAVVINRADVGDYSIDRFCTAEQIPVLLRIPDDRRVAQAYSRGELMVSAVTEMHAALVRLWDQIDASCADRQSADPAGHVEGNV